TGEVREVSLRAAGIDVDERSLARGSHRSSLRGIGFGVGALQFESDAGPAEVGREEAVHRSARAIEEHLLDARVVVEIFDGMEMRERAAGVQMERGRGVRGERYAGRIRQRGRAEESGDAG